MRLFVDMDGVLADFDAGHERAFGFKPDKAKDDVDWKAVREKGNFYLNLPPMPDMATLWDYVSRHKPTVLTGVPSGVAEAPNNKRAWVRKNLGPDVEVICCRSRDKRLHAKPGDVLIDDWDKHREAWVEMGGLWVSHVCASDTILQLKRLGL